LRFNALARTSAVLGTAVLGLALAAPASADSTPPPVTVPDTVNLYPGQITQVNVLANDTSPTGEALALCRFPDVDIDSLGRNDAVAMPMPALLGGKAGDVMVGAAGGTTHVVDYFVCDEHHLTPAQLTIQMLPVAPVNVRKVTGKPGKLSVQNTNDVPITFVFGHPRAMRNDGRVTVPAGQTRIVTVRRTAIVWNAEIGSSTGELSNPGSADHGRVTGIKLKGKALPDPKPFRP